MENEQKEKIMAKIRGLIAMQTSSNPNEVANASLLLKKILEKYDLDIDQIKLIEEGKAEIVQESFNFYQSHPSRWKPILASNISKFYDCDSYVYTASDGKKQFMFLGFKMDTYTALKTFERLMIIIEKESNSRRFFEKINKIDFCQGASIAIGHRLKEMIEERKKKNTDEKGLVILKRNEINKYIGKMGLFFRERSIGIQKNRSFEKGFEYGQTVRIHEEIR